MSSRPSSVRELQSRGGLVERATPDILGGNGKAPSGMELAVPGISKLGLQIFSGFYTAPTPNIRMFLNQMVGWTFACLEVIGLEYSRVKSTAYRDNDEGEQEERDPLAAKHWLSRHIRKPNPRYGRSIIRKNRVRWGVGIGDYYAYTPVDKNGEVCAEWALPADRMYTIPDANNFIAGYRYFSPSGLIAFEPWEIIHVYDPMPRADNILAQTYYGTGLIEKAWRTVRLDNETQEYLERLMANDAMPPVLLKTAKRMDKEQFDEFTSRWEEKYGNPQNRGKYGLLEGGMEVEIPNVADTRLKFYEMNKFNAEAICSYFGVPLPFIVGDYKYKFTAELIENKIRAGIVESWATLFDECFNAHWQNYEIGVSEHHEPLTAKDSESEREQLKVDMTYGLKTRNEIRERNGEDPVDGGDVLLVPNNVIAITAVANPQAAATPAALPAPKKIKKSMDGVIFKLDGTKFVPIEEVPSSVVEEGPTEKSDPEGFLIWKSYEAIFNKHTAVIERGVVHIFDELQDEVMRNFKKLTKSLNRKTDSDEPMPTIASETTLFDVDALKKKLEELMGKDGYDLVIDTLEHSVSPADMDIDVSDVESFYSKEIDRAIEASSSKIRLSGDTVKEEIRSLLKKMKDSSVSEVRDALDAKFEVLTTSRSQLIAKQSARVAQNSSQAGAYEKSGFGKQWLCSFNNSREAHIKAHGQKAEDGFFHVGGETLQAPCLGEEPANNINCECRSKSVRKS